MFASRSFSRLAVRSHVFPPVVRPALVRFGSGRASTAGPSDPRGAPPGRGAPGPSGARPSPSPPPPPPPSARPSPPPPAKAPGRSADPSEYIIEANARNLPAVLRGPVPVIIVAYSKEAGIPAGLEAAVKSKRGAFVLAKLDCIANPQIAGSLGLQELPTIIVVEGGREAGRTSQIQTAEQSKAFVDSLAGPAADANEDAVGLATSGFDALEAGDIDTAMDAFKASLAKPAPTGPKADKNHVAAHARSIAGLARCAITKGEKDQAREFIDALRSSYKEHLTLPEVARAISTVELQAGSKDVGDHEALVEKAKSNPKDIQARYDLARSFTQKALYEDAIREALAVVKLNKNWNEQAGKKLINQICEVLGASNELAMTARRKLSNMWFV